jgi:hypothetical protein
MGNGKAIALGVVKWKGLLLGAIAFLLSHQVLVVKWTSWFSGDERFAPWFLNAGNLALGFTVATLFVATLAGCALWAGPDDALVYGVGMGAGAFATMTAVMFSMKGGPGTLFPIVLAAGAFCAFVPTFVGALVVWPFKHRYRRG